MQTIQWTNEVIIACGVIVLACILLGYFIASLLQGRQLKLLAMQLEQGQATASAQQEALQEKLRAAEGRSHELQVIEGRLQAQLRADGAFLERTIAELQEYKKSAVGLGTKIEQQAQQHHDALTRLESALADGRALRDRVADLDGRLAAAQKLCDALRDQRGRLKDEVASEAGRAELAEASEREVRAQLERFRDTGLPLDHVDGHLNVHLHPMLQATLATLAPAPDNARPRPLWLVTPPQPLAEVDGRPCRRGPLKLLTGPERIESGWWDSGEASGDIRRDYFIALSSDGCWLWIYRDARLPGGWFLHGLFS